MKKYKDTGVGLNGIKVVIVSPGERGVVATRNFKKGEVIEVAPVITFDKREKNLLLKTELFNYYYNWGPGEGLNQIALCLGYGSVYNHSYEPNAEYDMDTRRRTMTFTALRPIKKGEEIRTNYNGDHDSKEDYHFKKKGKLVKIKP